MPPTVFVPRPKVDSALVRLRRRRAPPVTVPSDRRAVRARARPGSRSGARCCAARCAPVLGDRTRPTCSTRAGVAPTARAEALGLDEWAARRPGARRRPHEARTRPRHGVPEAHAVAARARPPARRLPRPRGAGRLARPAPRRGRGVRGARARRRAASRWSATRRRRRARPTTRNLAFIAAEKLLVRAGRSGHGVRLVLRKQHPRRRRARRRLGRRGRRAARGAAARSTSTSTTPACSRSRPRSGPTCRSACAAARRGCAGAARSSSRCRCRTGLAFLVAIPPFRLSTPDGVRGVGRARRPAVARAIGARAAPRRQLIPELANDLEPAAEPSSRGWSSSATRSRPPTGRPRAARGERLGLRGAGRRRAAAPGARRRGGPPPPRARRRHDERRRGVRLAQLTDRSGVDSGRHGVATPDARRTCVSGPADGAASASSSEASCASSSACACGAS